MFALVSASLGLGLRAEGSRRAPGPTSASALRPELWSFDFLLTIIASVGVRRIEAFPFIPPLDVTLNRVHFLQSDDPSPDTRRQMFAAVSKERLPLPLSSPNLMRKG